MDEDRLTPKYNIVEYPKPEKNRRFYKLPDRRK